MEKLSLIFCTLLVVLVISSCGNDSSTTSMSPEPDPTPSDTTSPDTTSSDITSTEADSSHYVALFYFSGFGETVYSNKNISPSGDVWISNGQIPGYGPKGSLNFWGKPFWAATHGDSTIKNNYRFYYNDDPTQTNDSLLDWHANMITKAGVDFVVLDFTNGVRDFKNGPSYISGTKALLNRWQWRKRNGRPTPQVVFFVKNEQTLSTVKQTFFNDYDSDLFFRYRGKKLLLVGQPNPNLGNGDPNQPAAPKKGLFANYTTRHCWGLNNSGSFWQFKVNSDVPPPPFFYKGSPEEMTAPVATQASYMTKDGDHPAPGAQGRENGSYFKKYMQAAREADVKFVFIHSWNEWDALNLGTQEVPNLVDQWNTEYSSDIEPMYGGHGDKYYKILKQEIMKFKQ